MKRLLIANRGEIACRIARTAQRMGIATVAVFSDADREALHVAAADRAERIGGPTPRDSYLNIDAIIAAALRGKADAIHPGYGFLSENATFAEACAKAGLTFVGPEPSTIVAMGDKARARAIAAEAGVPIVPGYSGDDQSPSRLADEAARIGFPLMVKAASGGGGRGMRAVHEPGALASALQSARREAEAAFGDGRLLLERLVEEARHIEVQVFGDRHGAIVHLGERDCSIQRRHQKIVEETPSPFVGEALRARLTDDALRLARRAAYVGAGTVEFVVAPDGAHFFLEMNTRLQVEHPVTEMVTGLDLVEWQIRVARGEPLPPRQDEIRFAGHAIEARLCAEDPYAGFLPQAGRLVRWRAAETPGLRLDSGVGEGTAVPSHYDPMVAKLVAHGADRTEALTRLRDALARLEIGGLRTNQRFLIDLVDGPEFSAGAVTTGLVDGWIAAQASIVQAPEPARDDILLAALVLARAADGDWFRSTGTATCAIDLDAGHGSVLVDIDFARGRAVKARVAGETVEIGELAATADGVACRLDGREVRAWTCKSTEGLWLGRDGTTFQLFEPDRLASAATDAQATVVAPLAGMVRGVFVAEGDRVSKGTPLVAIEAMKMETVLTAKTAGAITRVAARQGGLVAMRDVLVEIEPDPAG